MFASHEEKSSFLALRLDFLNNPDGWGNTISVEDIMFMIHDKKEGKAYWNVTIVSKPLQHKHHKVAEAIRRDGMKAQVPIELARKLVRLEVNNQYYLWID